MTGRNGDDDGIVARISEVARQAWEAQAEAARQSWEMGRTAWSSQDDPVASGRAWAQAVGREGVEYWRRAATVGIDAAGQLVTLWSRSMTRVMSEARAATRQGGPSGRDRSNSGTHTATAWDDRHRDPGGDGPESFASRAEGRAGTADRDGIPHVAVTLRGAPGQTAAGTVVLANPHPRARRVTLSADTLRPASGAAATLGMRVDPSGVTIPAGAEQTVTVEVDLPAETTLSGQSYTGTIDVGGGVRAIVDVTVEVT